MRGNALGRQPQALVHAKSVLLVHHGENKVLVGDVILEERMGADDNIDGALGQGPPMPADRPVEALSGPPARRVDATSLALQ